MANVFMYFLVVCCALSVFGCGLYSQGSTQPPEPGQQSAIVFGQQMIKDLSTGMDKIISAAKTQIKDEGDYRVMKGEAYAPTAKNVMGDFTRFCRTLQG